MDKFYKKFFFTVLALCMQTLRETKSQYGQEIQISIYQFVNSYEQIMYKIEREKKEG